MESNEQNRPANVWLDQPDRLKELLIANRVAFFDEHEKLLAAQVVLTDRLDGLVAAPRQTDERLNALITIVDGMIRNRPNS